MMARAPGTIEELPRQVGGWPKGFALLVGAVGRRSQAGFVPGAGCDRVQNGLCAAMRAVLARFGQLRARRSRAVFARGRRPPAPGADKGVEDAWSRAPTRVGKRSRVGMAVAGSTRVQGVDALLVRRHEPQARQVAAQSASSSGSEIIVLVLSRWRRGSCSAWPVDCSPVSSWDSFDGRAGRHRVTLSFHCEKTEISESP